MAMNPFVDRFSVNGGASNAVIGASGDRYYEGVDLTLKFATEIAASPYSGNPWAWIKARIQAADFTGIHVNDYIPFVSYLVVGALAVIIIAAVIVLFVLIRKRRRNRG